MTILSGRARPLVALLVLVGSLPVGARASTPAPELPTYASYSFERVWVPMRDGVEIAADVWRPETPADVKVPVILSLTPYHVLYKALDFDGDERDLPNADATYFVPKGYAYVRADVRGTYNSGGCWDYGGIKERQDGYDLVEWLGTRPWSNGKVAMTGVSYDGTTANAAAVEAPPHLATIVPISAISRWWGYAYQQGARSTYSGESLDIDPPSDTPTDFMFAYGMLPPPEPGSLGHAQQIAMRWNLCDRVEKALKGYDTEPDYDEFWKERDYLRRADQVEVPALVVHGQLDFNVKTWEGTAWYQALDTPKKLIFGNWPHASPNGPFPNWYKFLERWYQRWLYDVPNGVEKELPVQVQTKDGVWRKSATFGGGRTASIALTGNPTTILDDGALTESEMLRGLTPGRYLKFDLPQLSDLRVAGRPVLNLRASSDMPSTHFVAVLCEVGPTGAMTVISRAFMNARYRDGLEVGKDLEPNEPYTFRLEFIDQDHIVAPDRHLALLVASSSSTWIASDELRARNTFVPAESSLELPLVSAPSTLVLDGATSGRAGEITTLSARLTSAGAALAERKLVFEFQGNTYEATTGADGRASIPVPVAGPWGPTTVGVTYAGTWKQDPAEAEAAFEVLA